MGQCLGNVEAEAWPGGLNQLEGMSRRIEKAGPGGRRVGGASGCVDGMR
jgi:hypothetical protein